jgi:hypothetical protein
MVNIPSNQGAVIAVRASLWACLGAWLASCTTSPTHPAAQTASATAQPLSALHREDALWLDRVGFGIDTQMVNDYRRLGRTRWLDSQLDPHQEVLPAPIAAQIDSLEISHVEVAALLAEVRSRQKAINDAPLARIASRHARR